MRTSDGAYHQCFNGPAVVDCRAQVIVACELSDEAPDARQLEPALAQLAANLEVVDAVLPEAATLSADAGSFSADNVRITVEHGLDPHIATGRFKHSEPQPPAARGPLPKSATPKQRMARKLRTKRGRAVYARRKAIVEPVFGQIDTVQDGRKLLLRGKQAARAQWRFQCTIHNLLKLHRAGGLARVDQRTRTSELPSGNADRPLRTAGRILRNATESARRRLTAICDNPMPTLAPLLVTDPGS